MHYLQTLIDHYWNRSKREYLSALRESHGLKNVFPNRQVKLNEVVIIEETNVSRSRTKIGKLKELLTRKDWFNRGCKLRVIGKQGHYFIKRPVNKLYPLELEIRNSNNSAVKDSSENDDVIDCDGANRPKRVAAEKRTLKFIV